MDASLDSSRPITNIDQEHHQLQAAFSRPGNSDQAEIYFISGGGNLPGQSSDDQGGEQAEPSHKSRTNTYTSLVVLCLFSVLGVLVICVPFLPRRNSSNESFDPTPFIGRSATLGVLAILALIVVVILVFKKEWLHEKGLVIWPRHCEHCAFVMSKIRRDEIQSEDITRSLDSMLCHLCKMDLKTYKAPIIKSTLYITYTFSGLSICFIVLTSAIPIICILNDSARNSSSQTPPEIITGSLLVICLLLAIYLVGFRFIPIYSEAQFIAVPKIRWAIVLVAGVAIWIATLKLVRPFAIFANGDNRMEYQCPLNTTLGEFLKGVQDISQPFYIELAFMMAWQMMDIWFRFLPRQAHALVKRIERGHPDISPKGKLKVQGGLFNFVSIFKSVAIKANKASLPSEEPMTEVIISHNQLDDASDTMDDTLATVLPQRISGRISSSERLYQPDERSPEPSDPSVQDPLKSIHQRYPGYGWVEITFAFSLVVSGVYFGISNFLTGDTHIEKSRDNSLQGLCVQYLLKTLYFLPVLTIIMIYRNFTPKTGGCRAVNNLSTFNPSHGNYLMLLVTLTGACLFEMTFLAASVGNLFTTLSGDEIFLSIASLISSLFDILRKSTEAIFLLSIQHQYHVTEKEKLWTLLCLLYIGIANATQWLWDSLIHEAGSELAWPVLVMFFEGNVGQVIGMLLVPFVHLYGLHTAIMAFEIFKIVRYWEIQEASWQ